MFNYCAVNVHSNVNWLTLAAGGGGGGASCLENIFLSSVYWGQRGPIHFLSTGSHKIPVVPLVKTIKAKQANSSDSMHAVSFKRRQNCASGCIGAGRRGRGLFEVSKSSFYSSSLALIVVLIALIRARAHVCLR